MKLTLDIDQAGYNAWHAEQMRRVNDPDDPLMYVDVNDSIMIFLTAARLYERYPDARRALHEHAPDIIERAATELGMFMGATALAKAADLPVDVATETLMGLFQ